MVPGTHNELERNADNLARLNRIVSDPFSCYLDHWLHLLRIKVLDKVIPEALEVVKESADIYNRNVTSGWFDVLGYLFESYRGKKGRQAFGQFFTPPTICDLMVAMTPVKQIPRSDGRIYLNDPTSGSARLLLAAASQIRNSLPEGERYLNGYHFDANDLDSRCAKMSLINMFLHNMSGVITCADALALTEETFNWGYAIEQIPIKVWVQEHLQRLVEEKRKTQPMEEGIVDGKDIQLEWYKEFRDWYDKLPSAQEAFDYKFAQDIWYCDIKSGSTIVSFAGDNHIRIFNTFSKWSEMPKRPEPIQKEEIKLIERKPIKASLFDNPYFVTLFT